MRLASVQLSLHVLCNSDLKEYLVQKQLLQFPPSFKFRLDGMHLL